MKLLILLGIFFAGPALAAPRLTFEGVLTDTDGALLDGPVALTFALYDAAEGGAALWSETHPEVEVLEGDFYATLGDIEPLGTVLATDAPLWIGLAVDGEGELSPRNAITEVPRAAAALWAADVTGQHIHPREISVGDTQVIDSQGNWVGPGGPGGGGADYRYRFSDIEAGQNAVCGLKPDRRAFCWGRGIAVLRPPPVEFRKIAVGDGYACGIRDNGETLCWGEANIAPPPFGNYTALSLGIDLGCALTDERTLRCWGGRDDAGETRPPGGLFTNVDVGWNRACGITDGDIVCWGQPGPRLEAGGWSQVVIDGIGNDGYMCGLRLDGTAACIGLPDPPADTYQRLVGGFEHVCGLTVGGETRCWGSGFAGQTSLEGPGLIDLTVGSRFTCGLRADQTAVCWGDSEASVFPIPEKWIP